MECVLYCYASHWELLIVLSSPLHTIDKPFPFLLFAAFTESRDKSIVCIKNNLRECLTIEKKVFLLISKCALSEERKKLHKFFILATVECLSCAAAAISIYDEIKIRNLSCYLTLYRCQLLMAVCKCRVI